MYIARDMCKLNLLMTFLLNIPQETKETKKIPSENGRKGLLCLT